MDKSPDAFRTISEVSEELDVPPHVLRFWESRFPQIRPVKRAGGRRYYRPSDVALIAGIRKLLHEDGLTIRGVQKILREQGVRTVAALTQEDGGIDVYESEPMDFPAPVAEVNPATQGTLWPEPAAPGPDQPPALSAQEEALGLLQDFWPEELLETREENAALEDESPADEPTLPNDLPGSADLGIDAEWIEEVHLSESALAAASGDSPAEGTPDHPVVAPQDIPPVDMPTDTGTFAETDPDGEDGIPDLSLLPETAPGAMAPPAHIPVPGLAGIAVLLRNRPQDAPPLPGQAAVLAHRLEALRTRMVALSRGR